MNIKLTTQEAEELQKKGFTITSKGYRIIDLNPEKESEFYSLSHWYLLNPKTKKSLLNSLKWMRLCTDEETLDLRELEGVPKAKFLLYRNFGKGQLELLEKIMEEKGLKLGGH